MMMQKELKKKLQVIIAVLLAIGIVARVYMYFHAPNNLQATSPGKSGNLFTVEVKANVKKLYFNGLVQPKSVRNVSSPAEGEIRKKSFRYGETVKKGDELMVIDSEKLQQEYQQALTEFLKARESYQTTEKKWQGTEELYKLGFLSKNQYVDEKRTLEESSLQYYQARQKLAETVAKTNRNAKDIIDKLNGLSLLDTEKMSKALKIGHDTLTIRASADGVVLYPDRNSGGSGGGGGGSGSGGDPREGLLVGTSVKAGEVMLAIGDLSGLSVKFQVNEVNVLKLKVGDKVKITGVAFPDITLEGAIENIDSQAAMGEGGVPVFNVRVVVPTVTKEQLAEVHIGMSAKLEITVESSSQLEIPIIAVHQEPMEEPYVRVKNADGTIEKRAVQTGDTSQESVVILKGLNPGDQVVVSN